MATSVPSPLTIEVAKDGDHAAVTLVGEIDLATQVDLRQVLTDLVVSGQIHLTIDLSGVSFIDSTGLGVLIGARRRVHVLHGSLAIVGAHEPVMRVFEITGLTRVFDITPVAAEGAAAPAGEVAAG